MRDESGMDKRAMYLHMETGSGRGMVLSFDSALRYGMKTMAVKYPHFTSELIAETSLNEKWHVGRVREQLLFCHGRLKFQSEGA